MAQTVTATSAVDKSQSNGLCARCARHEAQQRSHVPTLGKTPYAFINIPQEQRRQASARAAALEERKQERKQFLQAVLRDEMLARLDAETERAVLEEKLGLVGVAHLRDLQSLNSNTQSNTNNNSMDGQTEGGVPRSPGEQYERIMEELRFVAAQPVGSKRNIIRLHYLIEEERRLRQLCAEAKSGTSIIGPVV